MADIDIIEAVSANPLAEMFKRHIEYKMSHCWDCDEPLKDGQKDYCDECREDQNDASDLEDRGGGSVV